jgi:hypothetical protein
MLNRGTPPLGMLAKLTPEVFGEFKRHFPGKDINRHRHTGEARAANAWIQKEFPEFYAHHLQRESAASSDRISLANGSGVSPGGSAAMDDDETASEEDKDGRNEGLGDHEDDEDEDDDDEDDRHETAKEGEARARAAGRRERARDPDWAGRSGGSAPTEAPNGGADGAAAVHPDQPAAGPTRGSLRLAKQRSLADARERIRGPAGSVPLPLPAPSRAPSHVRPAARGDRAAALRNAAPAQRKRGRPRARSAGAARPRASSCPPAAPEEHHQEAAAADGAGQVERFVQRMRGPRADLAQLRRGTLIQALPTAHVAALRAMAPADRVRVLSSTRADARWKAWLREDMSQHSVVPRRPVEQGLGLLGGGTTPTRVVMQLLLAELPTCTSTTAWAALRNPAQVCSLLWPDATGDVRSKIVAQAEKVSKMVPRDGPAEVELPTDNERGFLLFGERVSDALGMLAVLLEAASARFPPSSQQAGLTRDIKTMAEHFRRSYDRQRLRLGLALAAHVPAPPAPGRTSAAAPGDAPDEPAHAGFPNDDARHAAAAGLGPSASEGMDGATETGDGDSAAAPDKYEGKYPQPPADRETLKAGEADPLGADLSSGAAATGDDRSAAAPGDDRSAAAPGEDRSAAAPGEDPSAAAPGDPAVPRPDHASSRRARRRIAPIESPPRSPLLADQDGPHDEIADGEAPAASGSRANSPAAGAGRRVLPVSLSERPILPVSLNPYVSSSAAPTFFGSPHPAADVHAAEPPAGRANPAAALRGSDLTPAQAGKRRRPPSPAASRGPSPPSEDVPLRAKRTKATAAPAAAVAPSPAQATALPGAGAADHLAPRSAAAADLEPASLYPQPAAPTAAEVAPSPAYETALPGAGATDHMAPRFAAAADSEAGSLYPQPATPPGRHAPPPVFAERGPRSGSAIAPPDIDQKTPTRGPSAAAPGITAPTVTVSGAGPGASATPLRGAPPSATRPPLPIPTVPPLTGGAAGGAERPALVPCPLPLPLTASVSVASAAPPFAMPGEPPQAATGALEHAFRQLESELRHTPAETDAIFARLTERIKQLQTRRA